MYCIWIWDCHTPWSNYSSWVHSLEWVRSVVFNCCFCHYCTVCLFTVFRIILILTVVQPITTFTQLLPDICNNVILSLLHSCLLWNGETFPKHLTAGDSTTPLAALHFISLVGSHSCKASLPCMFFSRFLVHACHVLVKVILQFFWKSSLLLA